MKNVQRLLLLTIITATLFIHPINAMREYLEDYKKLKKEQVQGKPQDQIYARRASNEENRQRAIVQKIERRRLPQRSLPEIETQEVNIKGWFNTSYPTTANIKQLMINQYFPHLPQENIFVSEVEGGSFTDKIYKVSIDTNQENPTSLRAQPIFFLKISSRENSAQKLIDLQQGNVGRLGIQKMYQETENLLKTSQKDFPILTWLEKIFVDKDLMGNESVIEVTHAAQGDSLFQIMFKENEEYSKIVKDPRQLQHIVNKQIVASQKALIKSGKSLGLFQQAFIEYPSENNPATWQTVAHKDLHLANIFFDAKKSQTYFIDNETMRENQNIMTDVNSLLVSTTDIIAKTIASISKKSQSYWINADNAEQVSLQYSACLLQGYIESFPESKRASIAQLLQQQEYVTVNKVTMPLYYSPAVRREVIRFLEQYKTQSSYLIP